MSKEEDNRKVEDIFLAMGAVRNDSGKSLLDAADVHLSERNKEKVEAIKELEEAKMEETAEFVNAYSEMFGIENINTDRKVLTEDEKQDLNVIKPGPPLGDEYMRALMKQLKKK